MTQTKVEAPFVENNAHFRNLFINGDFAVAQRSVGTVAAGNGTYTTLDRMQTYLGNTSGAYTTAQTALSAADQATTGQYYAYDIQCSTADTSIASNAYVMVRQRIEAQFCKHLVWGSSAAKTLTLSFWVKSNLTGTTSGVIIKHDSTAQAFLFEYTINTTNTWEKKVIKVTPPSSGGTIDVNNGDGLNVQWNLHIGSAYLGGSNLTWDETNSYYGTTNTLNVLSSTSNDLFITGVQLEVGDVASEFEHLPYDVQLQRCRRYLQRVEASGSDYGSFGVGANANTTSSVGNHMLSPNMRAVPTLVTTGTAANYSIFNGSTSVDACSSVPAINGGGGTSSQVRLEFISSGNLTAGQATEMLGSDGVSAYLMFKAEL